MFNNLITSAADHMNVNRGQCLLTGHSHRGQAQQPVFEVPADNYILQICRAVVKNCGYVSGPAESDCFLASLSLTQKSPADGLIK